MKGKFLLPLVLLGGLTLVGCGPASNTPSPKVTYGVEIANKTALRAEWHVGENQRSLDINLTPAANPTKEIADGNLTVVSSAPTIVSVTGLAVNALAAGKATITVTYHGLTDSVEFTVLEKETAKTKYGTDHEGTAEDPLTNEDALKVAKDPKYADAQEVFYVGGIVHSFYALPGKGTDKTTSWYLTPAEGQTEKFEIYKCLTEDGKPLTDDDIWVGGYAIAYGKFTSYNSQYETSSAKFVSCTGNKPDVHDITATVAEALDVLAEMEDGATTTDNYIIEGVVTGIQEAYSSYKNMTFTIGATKDATDVLSCYRVSPKDEAEEAKVEKVLVGATVKVKGKLTRHVHSSGDVSPQLAQGGTFELVSEAPVEQLTDIDVGDLTIGVLSTGTRQLSVKPVPATAVLGTVTYTSGNKEILTVSETGLITGVAAGETTVTVACGDFSKVITVKVVAELNYGTVENPLTPDEARFLTRNFVTGAKSEQELTVSGVVSDVLADSYNHKVFWMQSEDGETKQCFECYQCDPATGVDVAELKVGATAVVKGYSKQYNETSEITSYKNADNQYVYPQILSIVPGTEPEEQPIKVTVAEARELIAALPVPTESGNQNVEVNNGHLYEITGTVTKLGTWNDSFGNGDMYIADEAGDVDNTLQLYRVNKEEIFFGSEVDATVVKVTSKLVGYFRDKVLKAYETPAGPTVEIVSGGKDLTLTGIDLGEDFELEAGATKQLTATLAPRGAKAELTWSVEDSEGAATEKVTCVNGLVTVTENVEVGEEYTIKATSGTVVGSVKLTIKGQSQLGGTDVLTRETTGVADGSTSYSDWSDKSAADGSPAVYAGQSAGSNNSIQLRSKNSNSGIISTTSGGKLVKVTVVWQDSTTAGNKLDIYGSNTAFTSPTQLYNISGDTIVKLGTIEKGTSTELVITGDYTFIGLRSNNGAIYLTSITIEWKA